MPEKSLAVFEEKTIRRHYDEDTDTWYFSIVDIVQVLIRQPDYQMARKYWNKLKERLKAEGSQLVTNCHRLKMTAADGRMRLTDVAAVDLRASLPLCCVDLIIKRGLSPIVSIADEARKMVSREGKGR